MYSINHSANIENCLSALRFWHKIEFFVPYNLEDAAGNDVCLDLTLSMLQSDDVSEKYLPWLKHSDFHYELYLLPFDKKKLTELSNKYFSSQFKKQNVIELEEKLDDEGLTCFACLKINKNGETQLNNLSISTLPWAMGKIQANQFQDLSEVIYEKDIIKLKYGLKLIDQAYQLTKTTDFPHGKFTGKLLCDLLDLLCKWAKFDPNYPFVVKIKSIPAIISKQESTRKILPSNSPIPMEDQDSIINDEATDKDSLEILNSFYIHDLEKCINHVAKDGHGILELFTNGLIERQDILAKEYFPNLLEALSPMKSTLGRWPKATSQMLSLMQQFCINQCIHSAEIQNIISTNGPPGTGKTTMLKDLIAANIVRRAENLARFDTVKDSFSGQKQIVINGNTRNLQCLHPNLVGFEMLVVSSNNNAVENITRELPLQSNLGKTFHENCHYLLPIAAKIAANHYNKKVIPVAPADKPWGLIAIALGNAANRRMFSERFFFSPDNEEDSRLRIQKGDYLTIWEWRNQYKGPSFSEAKSHFLSALAATQQFQYELDEFHILYTEINQNRWDIEIKNQRKKLAELDQAWNALNLRLKESKELLLQIENHRNIIYTEKQNHDEFKPSFWQRLFNTFEAKQYRKANRKLMEECFRLSTLILENQKSLENFNNQLFLTFKQKEEVEKKINDLLLQKQITHERYQGLQIKFGKINLPKPILSEEDHILGFWQTESFNQLRSELFIAALKLHEAWLAEALQKKYFGMNIIAIQALLDGKYTFTTEDELIIWQSLFMVVPVISSTFASVVRQFKGLGAHGLGWLLIDEAGQALPQAAIGALFRCKKVVVVGDPRQIEPILPVPFHLIEGLGQSAEVNPIWFPHGSSVQRLADQASAFGSYLQSHAANEWIGIPLLVHRRCMDPMFSIANEIAYDKKMINALVYEKNDELALPSSIWLDVCGKATDKQYVPNQGHCLLELFIWFYHREKKLPRLFIITPFKQIRKNLKHLIRNTDNWQSGLATELIRPTPRELNQWVNYNIGTVHTFQGKENEKVIFVLGADEEQKGAVSWASSKANLLNVAVTRAKDRFYVIGSWELWANRPYFCKASSKLERKIWRKI